MTVNLFLKIEQLRHAGTFDEALAASRSMRVVHAEGQLALEGITLRLHWLVDLEDGVIVDAKYQLFGPSLLLGLTEVACEWVILKSYEQARRTTAPLLERQIRDPHPLPPASNRYLNLLVDLFEELARQCSDIPILQELVTPLSSPIAVVEGGHPGWQMLSNQERLQLIEEVIKTEIRPYIEMDGGGVEATAIDDDAVTILYKGACTSCFSSTGATLSYIQQILQAKLWPHLTVIPTL